MTETERDSDSSEREEEQEEGEEQEKEQEQEQEQEERICLQSLCHEYVAEIAVSPCLRFPDQENGPWAGSELCSVPKAVGCD